jgi:hypothetical protein
MQVITVMKIKGNVQLQLSVQLFGKKKKTEFRNFTSGGIFTTVLHMVKKGLLFSWKLTLRLLMSYIYGAPILDVSRSHTTTHHSR